MQQGATPKAPKRSRKDSDSDDSESDLPLNKVVESVGGKKRDPLDLRVVVENDAVDCEAKGVVSWKVAHAGASEQPGRHLCVICGLFAPYKCIDCASKRISQMHTYICGRGCLDIHKNHNCGRPLNFTHW
ncbi:HIT zinc finger family protein [Babesia bovis T2Bo]|uniref:HIT zinc finger family protein n=1 Tax=Babesia bovis T2Bo TaxID=484906 RepID=UPI001C35C144|nr:HIT zinc finger family protein [Babesia bovis T2Bo]KAG6440133.1 HIT zinc finger family protein [Babesia bovis T2Bo]